MNKRITFDRFRDFWRRNPLVVIDSCSWLDLYRYAPEASKKILDNLQHEDVEERIWIPHQVYEEYFENKSTVISEAHKKFENVTKEVQVAISKANKTINTKFNRYGKFKFPEIHTLKNDLEQLLIQLEEKADGFKSIVSQDIEENRLVLKEDLVNSFISELKESGQLGERFSIIEKLKIYQEGEQRYKYQIPPGYKDIIKDADDKSKTKKFGDLLIWKELLIKASTDSVPFIFITDDEKEDWWKLNITNSHLGEKVEILEPREELLSEFAEVALVETDGLLMLTLQEFNSLISSLLNLYSETEVYVNEIELSPDEVVEEIINEKEWGVVLEDSLDLTASLIHDGELQDLTDEILVDVEILEFLKPEFSDLYADNEEDEDGVLISIEGNFRSKLIVNIQTALSSEYREWVKAYLEILGNINIDFKITYDEETESIKRVDESISIGGFEILEAIFVDDLEEYLANACIVCEKRPGEYQTNSGDPVCKHCLNDFDVCTACGNLFEYGELGSSKCSECDD